MMDFDPYFLLDAESRQAALARSDAQRITPAFSEALQQRTMQKISRLPFPIARVRPMLMPSISRGAAVATALAAAIVLVLWPKVGELNVKRLQSQEAAIVSLRNAFNGETAAVNVGRTKTLRRDPAFLAAQDTTEDDTIAEAPAQLAALDHDLRLAAEYLADQVPLRSQWQPEDEK